SLTAQTPSLPSRLPMPNTLPPATDGVPYPVPRPLAVQTSGGPPVGQSWSSPVSVQTSSLFGPRHRGQSLAATVAAAAARRAAARVSVRGCMGQRSPGGAVWGGVRTGGRDTGSVAPRTAVASGGEKGPAYCGQPSLSQYCSDV